MLVKLCIIWIENDLIKGRKPLAFTLCCLTLESHKTFVIFIFQLSQDVVQHAVRIGVDFPCDFERLLNFTTHIVVLRVIGNWF